MNHCRALAPLLQPSFRLPLIRTRYFLNAFQFDTFQTAWDMAANFDAPPHPSAAAQVAFLASFQNATLALIASLPMSTVRPGSGGEAAGKQPGAAIGTVGGSATGSAI